MQDISFYKGKKVFVTGHTGFKGTWLCKLLINAGAEVTGYSLAPPTSPNLYELSGIEKKMKSFMGDIRNFSLLNETFEQVQPEIVFHLAAQPIVRISYLKPVYTYETNVMGTVNLLECIRSSQSVKSFVNVTTDKVYLNREWFWGYREEEQLCGLDPYSNSKSCSELVTYSYKNSFFKDRSLSVSTARAGNVIGGGDFAKDRIIPDCIRAVSQREIIPVRNPNSIRPYQHVLEPVTAYLMIAKKQYEDPKYEGCYNVGPDEGDCIPTGELVSLFCKIWGAEAKWVKYSATGPKEANNLKLDCSRLKSTFAWKPRWHIEMAVEKVIEWTKAYLEGQDVSKCMDQQIEEFLKAGI